MSRKGIHLFHSLFPAENAVDTSTSTAQCKGRSEEQHAERNERLIHRFLFYSKITGLRYDVLTKIISIEFAICNRTVQNILTENNDRLRQIRADLPDKKELKQRWPFLIWEAPEVSYYI